MKRAEKKLFSSQLMKKMHDFKDILPGLSKTKVIFQEFSRKNAGLSRRRGNYVQGT